MHTTPSADGPPIFSLPQMHWVYPRGMDGKRSDSSEQHEIAAGPATEDAAIGAPESFGVVEFTRRVKGDGRALIVFTRPDGR